MYHKIKTTTRKFKKTAITVVVAIFIAGAANGQSKQSDIVGVWEHQFTSGKLTLSINDDMTGVFECVNRRGHGIYTVSVEYSDGKYNIIGKEWIEHPFGFNFFYLNGMVIKNDVLKGTVKLNRVATETKWDSVEIEKQLQVHKSKKRERCLLTLIGSGVFITLMVVIAIHSQQKTKKRKKEYQPIFSEIFKKRGFSATDIIWTNCRQIIRSNAKDDKVHNIVLGVKNGMVSFFGGGSQRVNFGVENEKVAFYNVVKPKWKKLLKEAENIILSNGSVAKTFFPKKDEKKFKHLVDVPIYAIKAVEGKEIGNRTELFIEYSDNLIKISPYCSNINYSIDTANIIIGVFNTILNGGLSNSKIYRANIAINEASAKDSEMTRELTRSKQNQRNKQAGGCMGLILSILTLGAVSGARNWSNDR